MAQNPRAQGWGSNITDFQMNVHGKRTTKSRPTEDQPSSRKKRSRTVIKQRISAYWKYNSAYAFIKNFVYWDDIEFDDEDTPSSVVVDEDSEDATPEESENMDTDECVPSFWTTQIFLGLPLRVTTQIVESYANAFADLDQPQPLTSYPFAIQQQILRHDQHYKEIMHGLFDDAALDTPDDNAIKHFASPFDLWMRANNDPESRERIASILLYPGIRSYKVRAALGKRHWRDLPGDLGMKPLDASIPEVIATYFLELVIKPDATILKKNNVYCGRATKYPKNADCKETWGALSRLTHYLNIRQAAQAEPPPSSSSTIGSTQTSHKNEPKRKVLIDLRLAHPDVDFVRYCLLSVFPPMVETRMEAVHFFCLLNLAESIDVIFLRSMSDTAQAAYGGTFAHELRPKDMPNQDREGLNRALPTVQPIKIPIRLHWEVDEVQKFIKIIQDFRDEIYHTAMNWDLINEKLVQIGILKPKQHIKALYNEMVSSGSAPFETYYAWKKRSYWYFCWQFKQFVTQNNLVEPPCEETDLFYHIQELENGRFSFNQVGLFLKEHEFVLDCSQLSRYQVRLIQPRWLAWFGTKYLPHLLRVGVWETIEKQPPELLQTSKSHVSRYVHARTREVVMYYVQQLMGAKQINSTEARNDAAECVVMEWPFFLEVYRKAMTRLILDGVPEDRVLPNGVFQVAMIFGGRDRKQTWEYLSPWKYEACKDRNPWAVEDPAFESNQHVKLDDQLALSILNESDDDEYDSENCDYIWPSEVDRYGLLSRQLQSCNGGIAPKTRRQRTNTLVLNTEALRNVTGQHKISGLRILMQLAMDTHAEGFTDDDYTDSQFWEHLFFRLEESTWGVRNMTELKARFSWILEYIRTGELPPMPAAVTNALLQVLYASEHDSFSDLHPYNMDPNCNYNSELIRPDLDDRWVKGILRQGDAAQQVLKRLKDLHNINITINELCAKYGILVAHAFELAYTQKYCNFNNDESTKAIEYDFTAKPSHPEATVFGAGAQASDLEDTASESEAELVQSEATESLVEITARETKVLELLREDVMSGNALTWMWLQLNRPHSLFAHGNRALKTQINEIDPDLASHPESLMKCCVQLREEFNITAYLKEEEFAYHGLYLPPECCIAPGNPDNPHYVWFHVFVVDVHHKLCRLTYDPSLIQFDEGCFVYFDEDGISFRRRDDTHLTKFLKDELNAKALTLYRHEIELQQQASSQNSPRSVENDSLHADIEPSVHDHRYTLEQYTWLFKRISAADASELDFQSMYTEFRAQFNVGHNFHNFMGWARRHFRPVVVGESSKNVKLTGIDAWPINQKVWFSSRCKMGMAWDDMAVLFAKKFNQERSERELRKAHKRLTKLVALSRDDPSRPEWLSSLSTGVKSKTNDLHQFTDEEVEWLAEELKTRTGLDGQKRSTATVAEVTVKFNKKFDTDLSKHSIQGKRKGIAKKLDLELPQLHLTKPQLEFLAESKKQQKSEEETRTEMEQKFGLVLDEISFSCRWSKLKATDPEESKSKFRRWPEIEVNFIRECIEKEMKLYQVRMAFEKEFGYIPEGSRLSGKFQNEKKRLNAIKNNEGAEDEDSSDATS